MVRGSNTAATFLHFLVEFTRAMDNRDKYWRQKNVMVMDNANIHKSHQISRFVITQKINILYSGRASYAANPIERVFGIVKSRFSERRLAEINRE